MKAGWKHLSASPLLTTFEDQVLDVFSGLLVSSDQRVVVAAVSRTVGVADLAHRHILGHSDIAHQAAAGVASALVQLDRRDAGRVAQLAEPLSDVVGVPRAAIGLAEHQ